MISLLDLLSLKTDVTVPTVGCKCTYSKQCAKNTYFFGIFSSTNPIHVKRQGSGTMIQRIRIRNWIPQPYQPCQYYFPKFHHHHPSGWQRIESWHIAECGEISKYKNPEHHKTSFLYFIIVALLVARD